MTAPLAPATDITHETATVASTTDILESARKQVLGQGEALAYEQLVAVLQTGDDQLEELLTLAHAVRMKWCGPTSRSRASCPSRPGAVLRTATSAEQSGQFASPVRAAWLNVPEMVEAARQTRESGATKFCIVAAVRLPDENLMAQMRVGVTAVKAAVDIQVHASLGMVTREQVEDLLDMGVSRYNHNLEAARSYFPDVVTTHSYQERWDTCQMIKKTGMELCCGGLVGMGETLEQRAELAAQLGELQPYEVPLNFLNPRPGTPFGDLEVMAANDALRTIAAFRLALPRTILRYAGGRELTLGDLAPGLASWEALTPSSSATT